MQPIDPSSITGEIIRKLRQLKGVKQEVICKKLGFTQQAYSKIECSLQVPFEKAHAILKALGSNEAELYELMKFFTPPPIKINKNIRIL